MVVHTRSLQNHFLICCHIQTREQTDTFKTVPAFDMVAGNKNFAIANRSRVSCAHNTSRASIGLITHDLEI